jgi:exodeoxyribonuclease-3
MRVISLNVNGIRAAERKGFFNWMQAQNADIICLQETKAQISSLVVILFAPKTIIVFIMMLIKKAIVGLHFTVEINQIRLLMG